MEYFDGPLQARDLTDLQFCFFGDSLIDRPSIVTCDPHFDLPPVGQSVSVIAHETAGFYKILFQKFQVTFPEWKFSFNSHAQGGATVRDIENQYLNAQKKIPFPDVSIFCLGINDIWRRYQGRDDEAVPYQEFCERYSAVVTAAKATSKVVVCIGEPLVNIGDNSDAVNRELQQYNEFIKSLTSKADFSNVFYIDLYAIFQKTYRQLDSYNPSATLWTDGVHLSDLGNLLAAETIFSSLVGTEIEKLIFRIQSYERDLANVRRDSKRDY